MPIRMRLLGGVSAPPRTPSSFRNQVLVALGADPSGFTGNGKGTWGNPFKEMAADDENRVAARLYLASLGYNIQALGFERGGIIPLVGAYEGGGVVGNGVWGKDSVLARYAGGGMIALAGGEGVLTAPATAAVGPSVVDYINQHHALPPANDRVPQGISDFTARPRARAGGGDGGSDARTVRLLEQEVAELRQTNSLLRQILASNAQGHRMTREAVEEGNGHSAEVAQEARLRRSAPRRSGTNG